MKRSALHNLTDAKLRCHVQVGSHAVPVYAANLEAYSVYGFAFDSPEPEIWINSRATKQQQARALVHETVEVINFVYDMGLSETHIRIMEQSLCQSFRMTRKKP